MSLVELSHDLERVLGEAARSPLLSPEDVGRFAVAAGRRTTRKTREELVRRLRDAADELDRPMTRVCVEVVGDLKQGSGRASLRGGSR